MKRFYVNLLAAIFLLGLLSGCKETAPETATGQPGETAAPVEVDFSKTDTDMFSDRDRDPSYDAGKAITIELWGNTAAASHNSVSVSGGTVTITQEATYLISGTLEGALVVNAPDTAKLQLVFNGVSITNPTSAALYIKEADKVFLTLADNTENSLTNGGSFQAIDDNNIDGALFSKQDLTLNGGGKLTVSSPAGHSIVCKDDLVLTGGSYTLNASAHGVDANDSVRILQADLHIDAGKDAIHAENSDDASLGFVYISGGNIQAEAEGDGITAGAYLQVTGGNIDLLVGGGSENGDKAHSDNFGGFMGGRPGQIQPETTENAVSMKGLKAATGLLIAGGDITVDSADDCIHADTGVTINGGKLVLASGDDAIHAETTLTVTAGTIDISDSYEGLEALDIDIRGGDIALIASDDGLNAAGGTDQSGTTGGRDGMFGGGKGGRPGGGMGGRPGGGMGGGPGGMGGGMSANSNGSVKISGGKVTIQASGDGIDANGTLEITGGNICVSGPTRGDTATLDFDRSGTISGGTFVGTGATGMAQTLTGDGQGVITCRASGTAGTRITLRDGQGNTLMDYTAPLEFGLVILSCPEMEPGQTYTVTVGAESGQLQAS